MKDKFNTIVIGAGQAGLATSYHLTSHGIEHVVLEKARIGEAWRSQKWDSFTLVTPNWTLRLPGFAYQGTDPDGFLNREEVIHYLDEYVRHFDPPVRTGIEVKAIDGREARYIVSTSEGVFEAGNVVIATGSHQSPKIPNLSSQIAHQMLQLHSSQYRNPQQLPEGAVLVVGSGQSGCQIADELCKSQRKTYLSTGKAGMLPRRYRGRDSMRWGEMIGMLDQPVSKLPSPAARFAANPQLTGRDGGQTLDLHRLASDGVILLGHMQAINGTTISFADDLTEHLAHADRFRTEFTKAIDRLVEATGMDAPIDDEPVVSAGYESDRVTEVNLESAGIKTIIWATGYSFDFRWIHFPIFDEYGYPIQEQGVTTQPGLYFVGLAWLHVLKSSLFAGVGEDAAHVVAEIVHRREMQG